MAQPMLDGTLFLHLPAHCFQPPQSSAPLPPTGTPEGTQDLREPRAQRKPLHTCSSSFTTRSATLPITMSVLARAWLQGPPLCSALLCSAQKPLDPELGDPSVAEQIPFTLGHWAETLPTPQRQRHHFVPEIGRAWGWGAFRWSLCSLPQNQVQGSGPAYHCHVSLEDALNHQPFAR